MLPILKVIVIVINSLSAKSNCNSNHYICFQEVIVTVMITLVSNCNKSVDHTQFFHIVDLQEFQSHFKFQWI